jgi:hypothetical protein
VRSFVESVLLSSSILRAEFITHSNKLEHEHDVQAGIASALWCLASNVVSSSELKIAALRVLVRLTSSPCTAALDLLGVQAIPALVHMLTQPEGIPWSGAGDSAGFNNSVPMSARAPAPVGSMADVQELSAVLLSQIVATSGLCLEQVCPLCNMNCTGHAAHAGDSGKFAAS